MANSDKPQDRFKAVTAHPGAPEFQPHKEGSWVFRFEFLNFSRQPPVFDGRAATDAEFEELRSPAPTPEFGGSPAERPKSVRSRSEPAQ